MNRNKKRRTWVPANKYYLKKFKIVNFWNKLAAKATIKKITFPI
jgi:hypothetical protein